MEAPEIVLSCTVLFSLYSMVLISPAAARDLLHPTNYTDLEALLSIKSHIGIDPLDILASWNDSLHFCRWKGVTCSTRHQRVIALDLSLMGLTGTLSSYVGNLTFLKFLKLGTNSFSGVIPQEIGRLYRLQYISLDNNSFQGEIPTNLTRCAALREIDLANNFLIGEIPSELSSLSNLQVLRLSQNDLGGLIPSLFGNLSALRNLTLSFNNLEGSIPTELAKLSNLEILQLSVNKLSGALPTGIFNISPIQVFSLDLNKLSGSFPWDLGLHVPGLRYFSVGQNQFSGPLPASVTNASRLQVLDIGMNSLSGPVPMSIGNLALLERLVFSGNPLGSPNIGLKFLSSMTNCSNLQILHLDENNHRDNLPRSITNLSTKLIALRLDGNFISGFIPESIGRFINLQGLYLSRNNFTGGIPSSIGDIRSLTILEMQENMLDGVIPVSLSNCTRLSKLDLSHNRLTSSVPLEILGPSSVLFDLSLGRNKLSGHLPMEVGDLRNLARLDVSNNNLSGELPQTLGACIVLEFLSLQGNHFEGSILGLFKILISLRTLDLSSNNFSGNIPADLVKLPDLQKLNLSFNIFEGEVPDELLFRDSSAFSIAGNKKLCVNIPLLQLPKCNDERPPGDREVSFGIVAALLTAGYLIFALLVHVCLFHYCTREPRSQTTEEAPDPLVGDHYLKLSYPELLQATDGFSPTNLIAAGRYSSVYKGILKDSEKSIAVKVINLQHRGARKSFVAECEALRNIRHRNLIKIITSCSGTDFNGDEFRALVYELMPNGSLENWLHQTPTILQKPKNLDLVQRLNIAIDIASAIDYLHHCCEIPVIHRDIKPSNILLDDELCAHLGDFGSARSLLHPIDKSTHTRNRSNAVGVTGTVGYVALEYAMGGRVSTLVDVYSYGILLLELFTGKRPTDSMFRDNFNLHNYVKMAIPDQVMRISDPPLIADANIMSRRSAEAIGRYTINSVEDCLALVYRVGVKCSSHLPRERMDIADALMELKAIREAFLKPN